MSDLMTQEELADYLQMHPQSLATWRYRKKGPKYLKLGTLVRYRRSDVEAWLTTQIVE